jgi:hypothetical protein
MKQKCNAGSVLLPSLLVLAVFLLFPNKAAAAPVLTPKYPSVVFEGAVKYAVFFTATGDPLPVKPQSRCWIS